ncbi:MAG: hypothetical protein ACK2T0_04750, partial [Anaerolineales bacterium]
MQLVLDGGDMLLQHWRSLSVLACAALGLGGWGYTLFPKPARVETWLAFPLSLGTGLIALILLSYVLFLASMIWQDVLPFGAYAIALAGAVFFVRDIVARQGWAAGGWPPFAFLLLLVVRLAFASRLVLPPYSDSSTHYLAVLNLVEPTSRPDALYVFQNILEHYYHYGVHSLIAWTETVSGETSPLLLAVVGQFFLAVAP